MGDYGESGTLVGVIELDLAAGQLSAPISIFHFHGLSHISIW